ncbi:hypothetical protein FRX31_002966 [Thalictrum thalictroides]|uniref:PHD-type zinc finger plants domain-containing protein n=1 Tax=Thalictrum thalictroides TaxID=46969 RepID=A0A7J6XF16_THATH|nr:hypothetical protein FRX31_002966 [Thalictrum thalictroides]
MTTKDAHYHDVSSSTLPTTIAKLECCMCGDYGLSLELFRCRTCLSRFQHRYCSNLYPKAETYRVCNWCLNKEGTKLEGNKLQRTRSFASLSFPYRSNNNIIKGEEQEEEKKKRINRNDGNHSSSSSIISSKKVRRGGTSSSSTSSNDQLHAVKKSSIKKQSAHSSDQSIGKKKMVFRSQGSLRRTKSEVFSRGKVQRYKLLEEVCIQ